MDVIPVIDLQGGQVVRARRGERAAYRPIETPLSPGSDAVDIVRGLVSVYPFATVYVADLDAIERRGDNEASILRIQAAFPDLLLWVDSGIGEAASARAWLSRMGGDLVLGSESQDEPSLARELAGDPRVVLSLDFRGESFLGPPPLLADPVVWPGRVIVMTLARVGSGAGPDLARIGEVSRRAAGRRVFAAGGIRDAGDLFALRQMGVAGVLMATSLHDGTISGEDIAALGA